MTSVWIGWSELLCEFEPFQLVDSLKAFEFLLICSELLHGDSVVYGRYALVKQSEKSYLSRWVAQVETSIDKG